MYRKSTNGWLKHGDFILLDLICLQIAFVLSYILRHGMQNPYANESYRDMAVFLAVADLLVIFFFESFKGVLRRGLYQEFATSVKHVILVELVAAGYLFAIHGGSAYSRISFFSMGLIYGILTYLARCLWKYRLQQSTKGVGKRSLLIITNEHTGPSAVRRLKKNNYERFTFAGVAGLDKTLCGTYMEGVPVVADAETVTDFVCREWVDEVILVFRQNAAFPRELAKKLAETGVTIHVSLDLSTEFLGNKQILEKIGDYTVLTSTLNYATARQLFFKRCMDIAGGIVGCILTGIIFLFVAPAIYIKSPGPIFFTQVRVGKNGKKFRIYKFRSMYMDAEERKKELMAQNRSKDGMMFKLDFDPRIIGNEILPDGTHKTGIGNFIRSTSLDEFPQFFNVLKGDMSLVGTRPPTLDEWEKYELHHRARLAIKPGITGMWQVSGRSNITDFEDVVRLDTEYITNWSMGLDIKILFKTVLAVLKRDGSM